MIPGQERVYLCGGMRSGWQDIVKQAHPALSFYDPREDELNDPALYVARDMRELSNCSIIFYHMESGHPSGWNAAFELGYMLGSGGIAIIVDPRSLTDPHYSQYSELLRRNGKTLSVSFTLDEGITALGRWFNRWGDYPDKDGRW